MIVQIALATETTAVRTRNHANVSSWHRKRASQRAMHVMRDLGARPERQLAIAVEQRDGCMLFDGQMGIALEEKNILEHVICSREGRIDVAKLDRLTAMYISLFAVPMNAHLWIAQCLFRGGQRRERLIRHIDEFGGLGRR